MKGFRRVLGISMTVLVAVSGICRTIPAQSVLAQEYQEWDGVVTGSEVNVRTGAGTGNPSIAKLNKGHAVHVIGEAAAANGVVWYEISFTLNGTQMSGYMSSAYIKVQQDYTQKDGYVTSDNVNVRTGAGTEHQSIAKLGTGHTVHIIGEAVASNGALWYQITFDWNGVQTQGYMHSNYVRVGEPPKPFEPSDTVNDPDYETYLEKEGFPESYRKYLRALHAINPLWIFVAQPTGIEWEHAVKEESKLGRNLVPASSITSYKSLQQGAIDWTTGTWNGYDGASWVAASEQVIRYFMDPRNFLNSENTLLQFESLEYKEGEQTTEGLANLLSGTHMAGEEFYQAFMEAGKTYGVSPYHLAARARQETGTNGSNSSYPIKVNTDAALAHNEDYTQFNGFYNFFNIGASPTGGHTSMFNGLARAQAEGWDTPAKSIMGGTKYVAERYVARGQNTLYLQKFDVVDGGDGYYAHQYMTNLQAAASEAKLMEKAYSDFKKATVTYIIPIYLNMPENPAPNPTDNGSAYSVLSSLNIEELVFGSEFDEYTNEYTVPGTTQLDTVTVQASAYAPNAVIEGTGSVALQPGENRITVTCTGSDASVRTYTVIVNKEEAPKIRSMGDVNGDGAVDSLDALEVLRASVQLTVLSEEDFVYADVNHNGEADADDALQILQYIVGKVPQL